MDRGAVATDLVRRLRAAGFETYLAGGCVRDRLLGRVPGDYDVWPIVTKGSGRCHDDQPLPSFQVHIRS